MKKLFSVFTFVLLNNSLFAHDFELNGIYYNLLGGDSIAVTYKGDYAHSYSNEYSGSVAILEKVTFNGISYRITAIGNGAFYHCYGLTAITIPNSITTIGESAFSDCSRLTNITIPNSVITIGKYAFSYCSRFTAITIPNSVNTIGESAFSGCYSLTNITIPNSVTTIGENAFSNCSRFTAIIIPSSVTTIGEGAFSGCSSVELITIEAGNPTYYSTGNCIIETTTKNLHTGCKNSIIPTDGSVITIGDNAFYGCSNLTGITIPNSITTIGNYTFYNCSNLTTINLPNSITIVGNYAFAYCSCLTAITCEAVIPPTIGDYGTTFEKVDKTIPLYVFTESIEAYKIAEYWKDFANILPIPVTPDTPTSVANCEGHDAASNVRKVFENGTMYILCDDEKYTIDGRKVFIL